MTSRDFSCTDATSRYQRVKDWRATTATDHFVQFYRTDDYLVECLAEYVADGVWTGGAAMIIATPEHRTALEQRLRVKGVDVISSTVRRHYVALDAREMLGKFMVAGRPDREAFVKIMSELMQELNATGRPLRAFGEMVALLWLDGNPSAAIELENLWNELGRDHSFALYCAYPAACVEPKSNRPSLAHICHAHSCVISLSV